jgi:tRNA-dihydrouridine synthase B
VRSARKHIGWYVRGLPGGEAFRNQMNTLTDAAAQWQAVASYFDTLGATRERLPAAGASGVPEDEPTECAA